MTRYRDTQISFRILTFLLVVFVQVAITHQTSHAGEVTADGAKLEVISETFKFTEGPIADQAGNVYFTDQPNDRIVKYDFEKDAVEDWLKPCGRSNGLYFVAPDKLIACADAENELWSIDIADKSSQVIVKDNEGRPYNGPNDCLSLIHI